jgi:hypothetical protein
MNLKLTFWAILFGIITFLPAQATVITSALPGGNWNDPASWQGGQIPGPSDTARIRSGSVIQITQPATVSRLVFLSDTASSTVRLSPGVGLTISGQLVINGPTRDNRFNVLDVDSGSLVVQSVLYGVSGGDSRAAILRASTGTIEVSGLFDMGSGSTGLSRRRLALTDGGKAKLLGAVQNPATLVSSPGAMVEYLGNGDFPLISGNYHKLTVQGTGTKTIGNAVFQESARIGGGMVLTLRGTLDVQDSLIFSGAVIQQNSFNLSLTNRFSLQGPFGAANHILQNGLGNLVVRGDSAERFTQIFPVGSNGQYTPFRIQNLAANFPGTSGSRFLEIKTFANPHPLLSGTNQAANRFWRLRSGNITVITKLAMEFTYGDGDVAAPLVEADLNTTARLRGTGWQTAFSGSSLNSAQNLLQVDSTNTTLDADYTFGKAEAFPASFPFVFTLRNGDWSTGSVWSSGAQPTAAQDAVVLHSIDNFGGTCNKLTVESMGTLTARQNNTTVNGEFRVKGQFNDGHSGGTNTLLGQVIVEPGASFTGTGSGGGTSFDFANNIENNGSWNVSANNIRFTRQVRSALKITGTSPVNFTRADRNILVLVDTLELAFAASESNPANWEPNLIVGDTNYNFNCRVWNKTAISLNTLGQRVTAGFERSFIQGNGAYLRLRSATPFPSGAGVLNAVASGSTIDYWSDGSQPVAPLTYFNLTLNGDRFDRFKTFGTGSDITVLGNLTINDNAACLQFSPNSGGQKLTINGNLVLNGNGFFRTAVSTAKVQNQLVLGGRIINNSSRTFGIDARPSDSTQTVVTITGSGVVAQGTGGANFGKMIFSSTDTVSWEGSGNLEVSDTLTNQTAGLNIRKGLLYVPTNARFTINGASPSTRVKTFRLTDRGDRFVAARQRIDLIVDSLFHMQADGRTSLGAFYDLRGHSLTVNGEYRVGSNGGVSGMRTDSLSSITWNGIAPTSPLALANGFRNLGRLIHNKTASPLSIGQPVFVHQNLDLVEGALAGTTNIRMLQSSRVRRYSGSIVAAFNAGSGKYNVEYYKQVATGPEAIGVPALGKFTLACAPTDTVTLTGSPVLDSNFVYLSGRIRSLSNNFLKMNGSSFAEFSSPVSSLPLPLGSNAVAAPVVVDLSAISGGRLLLKPFLTLPPNLPPLAIINLKRYMQVAGNPSGLNLGLSFTYLDADVNGDESLLEPYFDPGTGWVSASGNVVPQSNTVQFTGVSSTGLLTAFRNQVSAGKKQVALFRSFPNPSKGQIRLESDAPFRLLSLKDVLGREYDFQAEILGNKAKLDISALPDGLYFLTVETNGESRVLRLVKRS